MKNEKLQFVEDKIKELVPRISIPENFKMPAHPIRLEDVLEAVEEHINEHNPYILKYKEEQLFYRICDEWRYGKPLSDQSEELINYLSDNFEK